jgi:hypothetical protein
VQCALLQTQHADASYTREAGQRVHAQQVSDVHGHVVAVLHMASCQSQGHASIAYQIGFAVRLSPRLLVDAISIQLLEYIETRPSPSESRRSSARVQVLARRVTCGRPIVAARRRGPFANLCGRQLPITPRLLHSLAFPPAHNRRIT